MTNKNKNKNNNNLNLNLNTLIKPMSNEKLLLIIVGTVMTMIPIILMINNYAYENGKLVCNNYVLNSYLYTVLGFCFIALGVVFENKTQLIPRLIGTNNTLLIILGFVLILGVFIFFTYIIKTTDPNNFLIIHLAYLGACVIFGILLSITLLLGYGTGVLYQAIGITIGLTALMAFVGYKYGHLFISVNFDNLLKYALTAVLIWSFIAPYFIYDLQILILSVAVPSAIVFCLLLMSYNNQLRKNQKTCKVPNYPDEALGLVVKIGNLLADIINILMALKMKKGRK